MIKGGRWRVLAPVFSVATGSAFVWATIEALQADPDNLLLMLWALSFVASISTSSIAVYQYTCAGSIKAGADELRSAVDEGLKRYPRD